MSAPVRVQVEAEVNTATQDLWRLAGTPEETPSETNVTEQLEHLLARGADINARNRHRVTALMMAAYNGRLQMVRALIDHGADLNATREYGFTPLALAAFRGHTDVVRVLMERGADLNRATPFGTSAEVWATARSFSEIALYLERAGSSAPKSSAPKSSAPQSSANELSVRPSLPENKRGDEVHRADEHVSAKPLVVRTLKDPPEIWDLVQEAPREFKPGGAFVTRLTSSKTNLILLMLIVMFIAGLSAFALMRFRDDRKRVGAAAQVQDERGSTQTVPASQASAPLNAPVATVNAPENTQLNSQLNTTASAGAGVDNTPPQQTNSQPTNPQSSGQPDNAVSAGDAVTSGIQPTGVSVSNISKRTGWRVSRAQNADKRPARGESETAANPGTNARPQPPQTSDLNESNQKRSGDSSATKRSNTTASPQSSAPPTTSSTPKAKVIQWP